MRRATLGVLGALVLVGPTVLAFQTGGYFEGTRAWAGALAWASVIVAVALGASLPCDRWSSLAFGGLAVLAGLSLASITWAAVAGDAVDASQIALLYLGALVAAALVLGDPLARRLTEPTLALGAAVVIGYGLAGRLLPGVLHYSRSVSAEGRLEQPLTYWNAMGELAALGLVLCARLAGDRSRPRALRVLSAAAGAPLGVGLYASFSRGALFACLAGLVTLIALAPGREQLTGAAVTILAGGIAAAVISPLHGVTGLQGSLSHREHDGLIALVVLVAVALLATGAQLWAVARVADAPLPMPRHRGLIATAIIAAGLVVAIVVGAHETSGGARGLSGGATRLVSLRSNRYAYWDVALKAFVHEPLRGIGAGNWQVYWLRRRTIQDYAIDAHSLPLQTLAELGIVGGLALAAFIVGVFASARRALRVCSDAVGPAAALVTYLAHAPLDWDWEMPAVTLVAIALAGLLMTLGGSGGPPA